MNEITVEVQLTKEDYINQYRFTLEKENTTGITLIFGCIFLFLFGLLNLLISYFTLKENQFVYSIIFLITANFIIWFSIKLVTLYNKPYLLWKYSKAITKKYNSSPLSQSKSINKYDERGVLEKTVSGEYLTYWKSFNEIVETATDFVFSFNSDGIRFLPKRFIKDENELYLLRQIIKDNIGEKTKLILFDSSRK